MDPRTWNEVQSDLIASKLALQVMILFLVLVAGFKGGYERGHDQGYTQASLDFGVYSLGPLVCYDPSLSVALPHEQ